MTPLQQRLTHYALTVVAPHDFALGGCHALRAHRLVDRPCADVELLTPRVSGVSDAVPRLLYAYRRLGYEAAEELSGGSFARLRVGVRGAGSVKVKLCVDHRTAPPVRFDLGPVLAADDAVAGAVVALLGRHLAEDFIDVDQVTRSGRYTRGEVLRLGRRHDPGFRAAYFSEALAALRFIPDLAFFRYGLDATEIGTLRARFAGWQRELITAWLASDPDR